MNRLVRVWNVGKISYSDGLKLQKFISDMHHKNIGSKIKDTILLLEHFPVYTIGIRTKNYSEADEARLKSLGAEFYKTNRGGLITFHGPGQLVAYPILNLKNYNTSIRWYVSTVEQTIIELCRKLNIKATTSPHTGVWVGDFKICAIGMHASRYVTTHGLALNCNVDLSWYDHIVPCGIEDKGVTSLSEQLKRNVTVDEIVPLFLETFSEIFYCQCTEIPVDETKKIISKLAMHVS